MKKDLNLLLSSTIKTYGIILVGICVLKLCGLDYFALDTDNEVIININNIVTNFHLEMIWYTFTSYIYAYIILSISTFDNSKTMKKYALLTIPLSIILEYIKSKINFPFLFVLTDIMCLFVVSICYIKIIKRETIKKYNISNYFLYMIINFIYQLISVLIRDVTISNNNNFSINFILNFDYLILNIITYKLFFIKGGSSLWVEVVGCFSHLLTLSKILLIKLREKLQSSKKLNKTDKISYYIYLPLFILWNIFTVVVLLFIATLNHSFVECVIILSSFWINKYTFGKPFHMKTAKSCFIVSNLIYYSLNRITLPNGISLLISVFLGIALCCITSKFVKEKKLYRGMSELEYDNTVHNILEKDSSDYKIGKMYYVNKYTEIYIGNIIGYTKRGVQERKKRIKQKLER